MIELAEPDLALDVDLESDIACECMVCDLPLDCDHGPISWRVHLHFPGPYPSPGDSAMLLCTHCKIDWVEGDWPPPYDNFSVVSCICV